MLDMDTGRIVYGLWSRKFYYPKRS
jgi:hypothetical protein